MPRNSLKKILVAAATLATLPALGEPVAATTDADKPAIVAAAENAKQEAASVLVLIREPGDEIFASLHSSVAATILAEIAGTGIAPQSMDFLGNNADAKSGDKPQALSPAEAAELSGADYVLVVQIPQPQETSRRGVAYARQNVFYTLFSNAGVVAASGEASEIASVAATPGDTETLWLMRENLLLKTAKKAGIEIAEKIYSGKVKLEKCVARADVDVMCVIEGMSFPMIRDNDDGTFSITDEAATVSLAGANLKIGGIDYPLRADGEATKISLPIGVPLKVSVTHPSIRPLSQTYKIAKRGDSLTIYLTLNDDARKRWKNDLREMAALTEQLKDAKSRREDAASAREISAATAALIRGKAKFWENSGMKIVSSANFSKKISQEIKSEKEISAEVGAAGEEDSGDSGSGNGGEGE